MAILQRFGLRDKTIIVTGASSGLGRAAAIACANAEARVALIARNQEKLDETMSMMDGEDHASFSCDITDDSKLKNLFADIHSRLGEISGFVHSAGMELTLPIKVTPTAAYREILDVNTIAALELSRYILQKKHRAQKVSIVYLASTMGVVGAPALTAYSMSKGALIAAARSAAVEYAGKGVRINCVSPGHIEGTQMADEMFEKLSEASKEQLISKHPMGLGRPDDVANACIYLLSDASRWVTGTNLIVDGGYCAQ